MQGVESQEEPVRGLLSFVIPAFDEEAVLGETLAALESAARPLGEPFEVLVVADSCTDRTAEVAAAHGARVVEVSHRQISKTRNAGADEARGDRLIFVDADTLVTEAAVAAAVRAFGSGAIGGGARVRFDGRLPLGVRLLLATTLSILRALRVAPGSFFFCRRADFDAVGGFSSEIFAGEEIRLSFALKRRGTFVALDEEVITSSRKLRTHTAREILAGALRPLWKGRAAYRAREGLDIWYGARRPDPGDARRSG